jgi:hypothetical protein
MDERLRPDLGAVVAWCRAAAAARTAVGAVTTG